MNRGKTNKIGLIIFILLLVLFSLVLVGYLEGIGIDRFKREEYRYPEKVQPPTINIKELEEYTHKLINQERKKEELKELSWNSEVAEVAREHSQYLANLEENHGYQPRQELYISHIGEDGKEHPHRLEEAGINKTMSAENVAIIGIVTKTYSSTGEPAGYLNFSEISERSVTGWMESPGHKKNILTEDFEETGIGIATDPENVNYVFTQVFTN